MSRLLIPNTTQVPNVLIDVVMKRISDPGLRVLLAIVRKTYGFHKASDHISLTQLQNLTGLSRQGVVNGVRALGALVITNRGKRDGNEYTLNLDVSTGELVNDIDQSTGLTSQRRSKNTSQRRRHTKPNKNKTKEPHFSSPIVERVIRHINELSGRAFQSDSRAVTKYLRARLKGGATEAECLSVADDRWQKWGSSEKMREHFNPITLFREENFERYRAEASANGNGHHPKPAEVRDLGDGYVEHDGRKMRREDFERRYANGRAR